MISSTDRQYVIARARHASPHPTHPLWEAWFLRRPLFWAALASASGAALAVQAVPGWAWPSAAVMGLCLLALRPRFPAWLLLAVAFGGWRVHPVAHPPAPAGIRPETPITFRGVVDRSGTAGDRGPAVVLGRAYASRMGMPSSEMRVGLLVAAEDAPRRGDVVEVWGKLFRPGVQRNPGGRSQRFRWLRHGVGWVLRPERGQVRILRSGQPGPLELLSRRTRLAILERNRATLSPQIAVLANAMLLGEDDAADPTAAGAVESTFRNSGTIHLLVVSGAQVTLVLAVFLWLAERFRQARWGFWVLGLLALTAFYLLTEQGAAVSRASVMGLVFVGSRWLRRSADGENSLGCAALILFGLQPFSVFDPGFQLSAAAVWGLIRVSPAIHAVVAARLLPDGEKRGVIANTGNGFIGAFSTALAAHLAVAPVLSLIHVPISWWSIAANIPLSLLTVVMTYLSLAHAFLAGIGLGFMAGAVESAGAAMLASARLFAGEPFGVALAFAPPIWLLTPYYAGLAACSWSPNSTFRTLATTSSVALCLGICERTPAPHPDVPVLRAVDVGQGDALILQAPDGATALVDAGPVTAGGEVVRALSALRVARLELVVATHQDMDHIGGIEVVLRAVPTGAIVYGRATKPTPAWASLLAEAARLDVPVGGIGAGDVVQLGSGRLRALWPPKGDAPLSDNASSLVLRWESGDRAVLLPGDTGMPEESAMAPWAGILRADLLKVGHHGSGGSTGSEWLRRVQPRAAVISCGGGNRFGHPHAEALARLQAAGIPVWRTDRDGMITVRLGSRGPTAATYVRRE